MRISTVVIGLAVGAALSIGHVKSSQDFKLPVVYRAEEFVNEQMEESTLLFLYDDDIPKDVQVAAHLYGKMYDISPELLEAMAFYESSYIPDIDSPSGSHKGLMQINPKWHSERMERLDVDDLHDVYQNMHVAADYLSELFDEYEDTGIVLMKYNGDSSWKSGKLSAYAKKVLNLTKKLEERHGKGE